MINKPNRIFHWDFLETFRSQVTDHRSEIGAYIPIWPVACSLLPVALLQTTGAPHFNGLFDESFVETLGRPV